MCFYLQILLSIRLFQCCIYVCYVLIKTSYLLTYLSRLLVVFRTRLKSMQFHTYIHTFIHSFIETDRQTETNSNSMNSNSGGKLPGTYRFREVAETAAEMIAAVGFGDNSAEYIHRAEMDSTEKRRNSGALRDVRAVYIVYQSREACWPM